jgi:hypothetical protein
LYYQASCAFPTGFCPVVSVGCRVAHILVGAGGEPGVLDFLHIHIIVSVKLQVVCEYNWLAMNLNIAEVKFVYSWFMKQFLLFNCR